MRKCDSCGKPYQESKDIFCPHCGAVAQKNCTHASSFDSKRYDRGEIYKSNNSQYKNTTYNKGFEPHAQREQKAFGGAGNFEVNLPKINFPDIIKNFSDKKGNISKFIGVIAFCVVVAFNMVSGLLSDVTDNEFSSDYENVTEYEDINELYVVVDEATIEMVDEDGDLKTFTLEISGMGFDDYLPQNMQDDISSGAMSEEILSENTFVEMLICDFSKDIVEEKSYHNALSDAAFFPGEQVDGKCKYEFVYSFDYGEIVHIAGGVDFRLDNGKYINAELPFSAFSVSEDGEITYYSSYADSDTAWNTVFEECTNQQEMNRDVGIDFAEGE